MRLLNVNTEQLVTCDDNQPPSYAILSHTWGTPDDEVSFQDVQTATVESRDDPSTLKWKKKPGWVKIQRACKQALQFGYQYLWVDTCCIDKSSSAELQEGINSMFRWYEGASVCYAYLSDVASDPDPEAHDSTFRKARWFLRGWTLQELLAPEILIFFDRDWNELGDKSSLASVIEEITGIEARYMGVDSYLPLNFDGSAYERLSEASIAQRMSWMSRRETTRREDMAYCLLGIFDIHMPMLYGEGNKAFKRLQEEIMKASDDTTLLSWGYKYPEYGYFEADSILAPNPASFKNCHNLMPSELSGFPRPSFSITQRGLILTMPMRRDQNHGDITYAILACGHSESMLAPGRCQKLLVIPLISVSACDSPGLWKEQDEYLRYSWSTPSLVSPEFLKGAETKTVVIRRPSRLTAQLRYLPGVMRQLRGGKMIGMYPPQPGDMFSGTRFVPLNNWFVQSQMTLHHSSPSETSSTSFKDSGEAQWDEKRGTRMFFIEISSGNLLVVLEYEMKLDDDESKILNVITCRVFELSSKELDLELVHNLALSKEYTGLQEIPSLSGEEDRIFRIKKGEEGVFLFVRVRRSPGFSLKPMTEIEIFTERQ